jgi:hypothetical protein
LCLVSPGTITNVRDFNDINHQIKTSPARENIPSQDNIALIRSSAAALEESKLKTALLHLSSMLQKKRGE